MTTIVILAGLLIATWGCAERSRLGRCACALVLPAAVGDLIVGWLRREEMAPREAMSVALIHSIFGH